MFHYPYPFKIVQYLFIPLLDQPASTTVGFLLRNLLAFISTCGSNSSTSMAYQLYGPLQKRTWSQKTLHLKLALELTWKISLKSFQVLKYLVSPWFPHWFPHWFLLSPSLPIPPGLGRPGVAVPKPAGARGKVQGLLERQLLGPRCPSGSWWYAV